jgi:deazaflavin-dependent oxidoreductase (nitroreductase family)
MIGHAGEVTTLVTAVTNGPADPGGTPAQRSGMLQPMGADRNAMDSLRPLRRLQGRLEAAQVRRFGDSALSVLFRTPVLVLVTTGRRTGRRRQTTVAYHRMDDGALIVVGGAGGQRREPDWVANLRADPAATVVVDRRMVDVVARELAGEERSAVWTVAREVWPRIEAYERRAGRPVPVFRVEP